MSNISAIVLRVSALVFALSGITSCSGGGGVSSPPPSGSTTPTVSLSAASVSVAYNGSTTITWSSTNSTSCISSGGGGTNTWGSFNTGALTSSISYIVTCVGVGGTASQSLTITVAPAAITAFASGGTNIVRVTSDNSLTIGSVISISGTTNYDGTYTVLTRTDTSFTIAAPFVANDATGTWQLAGGMISGCSSSGDTDFISLSNIPSRFNGVAPFAVFFDATETATTPSTPRPFHDLEYRWNFGDDAGSLSGTTWSTGSRAGVSSRNAATGPVASHVFETPGTYIVTLSATDGTNTVTNECAKIVVQNPDDVFAGANTICIGAAAPLPVPGSDGCPVGAVAVLQQNFAEAIGTYAQTGKRVLFRKGDTFSTTTTASLTSNGPGTVGAFGNGANPAVRMSGNTNILKFSSATTPEIGDWRVIDLELDGMSGTNTNGIVADGGFKNFLALRLHVHHTGGGIIEGTSILDWWINDGVPSHAGHTLYEDMAIVDSVISGIPGCNDAGPVCGWGIFLAGIRSVAMGNYIDNLDDGGTHTIRSGYLVKGIISNNTLARPGITQLVIKLHGPTWCDVNSPAGECISPENASVGPSYTYTTNTHPLGVATPLSGYTEKVVISDNQIIGGAAPWAFSIGPQSAAHDERVRDVILERNWFKSGSGGRLFMHINSSDTTIRNNICDMTGGIDFLCVDIAQWGTPGFPPANVRVYNNTFYSNSAGDLYGVTIDSTATNVSVINNLGSAP
ncbi:MAG: PKD domain-containing protein [Gammaproteobacteria bacterium]|nr:PKD domain-containing protein [Gammaproteobacteria bacterium]